MLGRIKLDKADQIFSSYLRTKIPYCEVCKREDTLQASHFWGRRNESTRFDEENVDVLCFSCHLKFHENPGNYTEWKKKKLGLKRYNLLDFRHNQYKKRDRKLEYIIWKKAYEELTK